MINARIELSDIIYHENNIVLALDIVYFQDYKPVTIPFFASPTPENIYEILKVTDSKSLFSVRGKALQIEIVDGQITEMGHIVNTGLPSVVWSKPALALDEEQPKD